MEILAIFGEMGDKRRKKQGSQNKYILESFLPSTPQGRVYAVNEYMKHV